VKTEYKLLRNSHFEAVKAGTKSYLKESFHPTNNRNMENLITYSHIVILRSGYYIKFMYSIK